jgi:hypothetical protein
MPGKAVAAVRVSKRGRVNEGRPTKYADWMIRVARVIGRLGGIIPDFAEAFDVDERTVSDWIASNAEFSQAVNEVRDLADEQVERSLFQRACGFEHPSEKIMNFKGDVIRAPFTKKYAPDTLAAIYWLNNRRPARWRQKIEVTGGGIQAGSQVTPEQVVDGLVSFATKYPIIALPMRELLESALKRIPIPE